ncbi:hypothetical protein BDZ89DRAFT_1203106 [Hymenopellis radicata]|nr:hypothetical protein BDZ89DRAFT_1203106 [Hymenopellis radicata]
MIAPPKVLSRLAVIIDDVAIWDFGHPVTHKMPLPLTRHSFDLMASICLTGSRLAIENRLGDEHSSTNLLQLVLHQRNSWPHTDDSGKPVRLTYKSATRKELTAALLDPNNLFSTSAEAPENIIPLYLNSVNADDAQSVTLSAEGLPAPSGSAVNLTAVAPYVHAASGGGQTTLGFHAVTVEVEDRTGDNVLLSAPIGSSRLPAGSGSTACASFALIHKTSSRRSRRCFSHILNLQGEISVGMDDVVGPDLEMGLHHLYAGMIRQLFRAHPGEDGISTFAVGTIQVNLTKGLKIYIDTVAAPLPLAVSPALLLAPPMPPSNGPRPDWEIIRNHILSSHYALDYQTLLHIKHKVLDNDEDIIANWHSIAELVEFYSTVGIDGRRFCQSQIALAINIGMQSIRAAKKGLQLVERCSADEFEFNTMFRDHGKHGKENLLKDLQLFDTMQKEKQAKRKHSRKGKGKARSN